MKRNKGRVVFFIGSIVVLVAVLLVLGIKYFKYRSDIPEMSNYEGLAAPVAEQISEAVKKAKRNPSIQHMGMLGMAYHSSANYDEASASYKLAASKKGSPWIWNYYQGYLHSEMGDSEQAIDHYQKVLSVDPDNHHALYYCGKSYGNLGEYEKAEQCFGEIKGVQKGRSDQKNLTREDYFSIGTYASYELSRIFVNTGRTESAEKTLLQLVQNDPLFGQAFRLLGNIYQSRGDIAAGEYYRIRATELMNVSEPVDTLIDRLVLTSRSDQYILKKIDDATRSIYSDWTLKLIDHSISYLPDNKHLVTKALETWLWLDETERAIRYAEKHISMFRDSETGLSSMGKLFFSKDLYNETILYFSRLLELNPEVLENYKILALCYWRLGEKKKSLETLNKIIEKHPSSLNVLAYYTEILVFEFGSREIAENPLQVLNNNSPTLPKVQKINARFAETDGKTQRAIALYEASFRGDPEDKTTITLLGNLLVRQKLWGKAIRHFRQALEHHPNDPTFLERVGTLQIMSPDLSVRNPEEGMEYALRAFTNQISSTTTRVSSGKSLALAHAMQGNKTMANSILEAVIGIARYENFPPSEMAVLEDLSNQFREMEDKVILPAQ